MQNALRLRPPGSFFVIMVSGGSTMVARLGFNPFEVALWTLVGVGSGLVLGLLPALLDPHAPERRAVVTLDRAVADFEAADKPTLAQRHQCANALAAAWEALGDARIVHAGRIVRPRLDFLVRRTQECQIRLVGRTAELGLSLSDTAGITDTPTMVDPARSAIPHTRPSNNYRIFRSMDLNSHASVTAQKVFIACITAGVAGIALGLNRPDWAIVSAMLMLQWGPDRTAGQIRGIHRLIGSLLGIGLFAAFHVLQFQGWQLLIALAVCQFFAEVFAVKNYAFCVIFTTPLALLMGNAVADPLGGVVVSRTAEVLLSIVFASLALWLWRPGAVRSEHTRLVHRAFAQMGAVIGGLATGTPAESVNTRRDLQYELLSERRAIQALAEADRTEAEARWPITCASSAPATTSLTTATPTTTARCPSPRWRSSPTTCAPRKTRRRRAARPSSAAGLLPRGVGKAQLVVNSGGHLPPHSLEGLPARVRPDLRLSRRSAPRSRPGHQRRSAAQPLRT